MDAYDKTPTMPPRYLPKKRKPMPTGYIQVHICPVCKRQEQKAIRGSLNRWKDKQTLGHPYSRGLCRYKKGELSIHNTK